MGPYERLLGDAAEGDATLFAREDAVEATWRIVDPALEAATSLHEYEPGRWGPPAVERMLAPEVGGGVPMKQPTPAVLFDMDDLLLAL